MTMRSTVLAQQQIGETHLTFEGVYDDELPEPNNFKVTLLHVTFGDDFHDILSLVFTRDELIEHANNCLRLATNTELWDRP